MDTLASVYGWSIEYSLDQPYTKLKELLNSIKFREYLQDMKLFRLINLAQGGEQRQVDDFFKQLKPKIVAKIPDKTQPAIKFEAMDLSGFHHIVKE